MNRVGIFCLLFLVSAGGLQAHEHAPPIPAAAVNADMAAKATAWLETLDDQQREAASFAFDSEERLNWHFIPRERLGLPIKQMSLAQRRAAYALLRSGLSHEGYLKATTIMSLEGILRELEKDRPGNEARRDPEKYCLSVFGMPSAREPWGWRFEGHHLSLNFSSVAGLTVASTPLFLGANPAEVRTGPHAGQRVLAAEEDLARHLMRSLSEADQQKALLAADAPDEVFTVPDKPIDLGDPAGLAFADMPTPQQRQLERLIAQVARTLRGELADGALQEIRRAGLDRVFFAWAGSLKRGEGHYYRVTGPTFIIEYDNTQNDANHVHVVWHSLESNFGLDALRQHYHDHHPAAAASASD
jgi:hypothetical protein